MKNIIARILVCIMLSFVLFPCSDALATSGSSTDYDIRQFRWGDTKEYVLSIEGTPSFEGEVNGLDATYIAYETTVVGLDAFIAYYFCGDGLFEARYILTEDHSNDSLYIDDYTEFKSALTKKYGEPIWDYENWTSDLKKEYYSDDMGQALCFGYVSYSTWYITDRTYISMSMSADNYDITTSVDYESVEISAGETDFSDEI